MSQIQEVNRRILNSFLKTDENYEALFGKEDFTPNTVINNPNDFNCGAIANALEYINRYVEEITGGTLEELTAPYLDTVVYFFTRLRRTPDEQDAELLRRMYSLLVREDDWRSERFGTPWDLKNVFSYYLDRNLLYYIPNAVETDILVNGDFETAIGSEWNFTPSGDRSVGDSFTGSYKVDFTDTTDLDQDIAVTTGTYVLNCFVKPVGGQPAEYGATWSMTDGSYGNAAYTAQDFAYQTGSTPLPDTEIDTFNLFIQRDSDNYYYNAETFEWTAASVATAFTSIGGEYQLASFFIVADGSYNINIKFSKIVDFYLDRVEFGLKEYPCFEFLYIDDGDPIGFASAWGSDPEYENASYIAQDYAFSTSISGYSDEYYQELLDMIKAAGVKGIYSREVRT